ncbi:MAG TPA: class I SAM-dependent methyltransferase [Spirochaetota bacterium]|nr:class I SAM-dependent methyltransferase [Spirochaetota bacterium]HPJ43583.1 class I SAM-dependent methyltransferase [Spirochaetota bacterium]HRX48465.1 class I SAM-dependent methyltransferase [Spirochaetota bacterium]
MFNELSEINRRPEPYEFYTAAELWTDEYTSQRMLEYHLNESVDAASRNRRFIDRSAEWIIEYFNLAPGSRVIDFGCGPGLYTSRLARCGADITGVDFSKRSLDYANEEARRANLNINYIHSDYLEYETEEKFDLAVMIMCDFAALSPAQRSTLLGRFHKILKTGGYVLLDVYSLNYFRSLQEKAVYEFNMMDRFWSAGDCYTFLNTFKYDDEKVILDKYTIYSKSDKRVVYNWLQCFSEKSIKDEFKKSGFRIKEIFSDVAGSVYNPESHEFAVVAFKE